MDQVRGFYLQRHQSVFSEQLDEVREFNGSVILLNLRMNLL